MYLTGIQQQAVAVLEATSQPDGAEHKFTLFLEPQSFDRDQWDGARLDAAAAQAVFGAHEVHDIGKLPRLLADKAINCAAVMFDMDKPSGYHYNTCREALSSMASQAIVKPLRPYLHALRWVKSPAEAALMRRSAQIAASAHRKCMMVTRPGLPEYAVAAMFEYQCRVAGAQRLAYPTVAASGADANTIHYSRNDKLMQAGTLMLMDAGCEYHGYVSDITRVWPVSGRFSSPQRDVYEMVLDVHHKCVVASVPGTSIRQLHQLSVSLLCEGMVQLGVARGPAAALASNRENYKMLYCHSVGHWLGLSVHDTALIGHDRMLQPGNVITIEPGLYMPNHERFKHFAGIGIRLEDDVLITEQGCEILSQDVPLDIATIEELVGQHIDNSATTGFHLHADVSHLV